MCSLSMIEGRVKAICGFGLAFCDSLSWLSQFSTAEHQRGVVVIGRLEMSTSGFFYSNLHGYDLELSTIYPSSLLTLKSWRVFLLPVGEKIRCVWVSYVYFLGILLISVLSSAERVWQFVQFIVALFRFNVQSFTLAEVRHFLLVTPYTLAQQFGRVTPCAPVLKAEWGAVNQCDGQRLVGLLSYR